MARTGGCSLRTVTVTSRAVYRYWLRPYLIRTLGTVKRLAAINTPPWLQPRLGPGTAL